MTAVEIVKEIFAKHAEMPSIRGSARRELTRTRTYCVQYRESDLNFVEPAAGGRGHQLLLRPRRTTSTRWSWPTRPRRTRPAPSYERGAVLPQAGRLARRERDHVFDWDAGAEVRSGSYAHTQLRLREAARRPDGPTRRSRWRRPPGPRASSTTIPAATPSPSRRAGGRACGSRLTGQASALRRRGHRRGPRGRAPLHAHRLSAPRPERRLSRCARSSTRSWTRPIAAAGGRRGRRALSLPVPAPCRPTSPTARR